MAMFRALSSSGGSGGGVTEIFSTDTNENNTPNTYTVTKNATAFHFVSNMPIQYFDITLNGTDIKSTISNYISACNVSYGGNWQMMSGIVQMNLNVGDVISVTKKSTLSFAGRYNCGLSIAY